MPAVVSDGLELVEVEPLAVAALFVRRLVPGPLHEDAAHGLGGRGEEVATAVPLLRLLGVHQAEVGLMDQRARLIWWTSRSFPLPGDH